MNYKVSTFYNKDEYQSHGLGVNFDDHIVLESATIRKIINSHDEINFQMYFSEQDKHLAPISGEGAFHILRYKEFETEVRAPTYMNQKNIFKPASQSLGHGFVSSVGDIVLFSNTAEPTYNTIQAINVNGETKLYQKYDAVVDTPAGSQITVAVANNKDDDFVWEIRQDKKVYVYNWNVFAKILERKDTETADFTIGSEISTPTSALYLNGKLFIADNTSTLKAYTATKTSTTYSASDNVTLTGFTGTITGITRIKDTIFIQTASKAFAFDTNWNRQSSLDFTLNQGTDNPEALLSDDEYLYTSNTSLTDQHQNFLLTYKAVFETTTKHTPTSDDIIYTFWSNRHNVNSDRDGGEIHNMNAVSFTFELNYITLGYGRVKEADSKVNGRIWYTDLIASRFPSDAPSSTASNYDQLLWNDLRESFVAPNTYPYSLTSADSTQAESVYDVLENFADTSAVVLWRTDWRTDKGKEGRCQAGVVQHGAIDGTLQDAEGQSAMIQILNSDQGELQEFYERGDKLNTLYMIAPTRQGDLFSVTRSIFPSQILYSTGVPMFALPTVKLVPKPFLQSKPVRNTSKDFTPTQALDAYFSTGSEIIGLRGGLTSAWVSTDGSSFTEHQNAIQITSKIIGIGFDPTDNTVFVVSPPSQGSRDAKVTVFTYSEQNKSFTKITDYRMRVNYQVYSAFFDAGVLYIDGSGSVSDPSRVVYAFDIDPTAKTATEDIDNRIVKSSEENYGGMTKSIQFGTIFLCEQTGGSAISYASGKPPTRVNTFDFNYSGINVSSSFAHKETLYLYDGTANKAFAFDLQSANTDTTKITLQGAGSEEHIDDYDFIWEENTVQLNPEHLNNQTHDLEISGHESTTNAIKVKFGSGSVEVAAPIVTRKTDLQDIKEEAIERITLARAEKHNGRLTYNLRYQPDKLSFYAPRIGDQFNYKNNTYIVTGINETFVGGDIVRTATYELSSNFFLDRSIKNYETIVQDSVSSNPIVDEIGGALYDAMNEMTDTLAIT